MTANACHPLPVARALGLDGRLATDEVRVRLDAFLVGLSLGLVASIRDDYTIVVREDDRALVSCILQRADERKFDPGALPLARLPELVHAGLRPVDLRIADPGLFASAHALRRVGGHDYRVHVWDSSGAGSALARADVFSAFAPAAGSGGLLHRLGEAVSLVSRETGAEGVRALAAGLVLLAGLPRARGWWVTADGEPVASSCADEPALPPDTRLSRLREVVASGLAVELGGRTRLSAVGSLWGAPTLDGDARLPRVAEVVHGADDRAEQDQWSDPAGELAATVAEFPVLSELLRVALVPDALSRAVDELVALGLTQRQAALFVRTMAGETAAEIGADLGVAPSTVSATVRAGVAKLRKIFAAE